MANEPNMFCMQCEQTDEGVGCIWKGNCGKTPDVAALQDLLIDVSKGIGQYAAPAAAKGIHDKEVDEFQLKALFSTITNVNFDDERMKDYIAEGLEIREKAHDLFKKAGLDEKMLDASSPAKRSITTDSILDLVEEGKKVSIPVRQKKSGKVMAGLQELILYGLKGTAAYCEHAQNLGSTDQKVYDFMHETMDFLASPAAEDLNAVLGQALKVGECNLHVMEMLSDAHDKVLGTPEPTPVSTVPAPGKCILVSGHDMVDLKAILEATKDKDVNVYTHGEMLPAHSYPELKKYEHLKGHWGSAWQKQRTDFAEFPGAVVLTSNCLIKPRPSYEDRIFTLHEVGWPGVKHLGDGENFDALIESAKASSGFTKEDTQVKRLGHTVGFGHKTVIGLAETVINSIKTGDIKQFWVIGGCDGAGVGRNYFNDLARSLPKDNVCLTLGCGKFRINDFDWGTTDAGIPRLLDVGQCNDAIGAIKIASALSEALDTPLNDLPINYAISWFEQKAVAVLLTMLHLNIQNIHLGPNLPAFVEPEALAVLVEKFKLSGCGTPKDDFGL
eukprot:TRINITY_DN1823_c0_g1_i2.p1 TRINITY_DN1823_c0_g1~~TRINITY_DN1823_c0_g1_i2.p1  ORF type:complete len:574 (-),score=234.00 TRINITY_DN1823_c0_g1_i2:43-1710(-)